MKRPSVGIGVLVHKDGLYLMGRRIGSHGRGTWSVPGGYLEFGESWEDCAAREVLEECGVGIKNTRFLAVVNNVFRDEGHHSITIFMKSEWQSGEPKTIEQDKFVDVSWFSFDNLPEPLFLPMQELKKSMPELFKPQA